MWRIKQKKRTFGAPVKGAAFFGPSAFSVLFQCVAMFFVVCFVVAFLTEPAVRINTAGLWLKFWYGEGYWEWARNGVYLVGLCSLWMFCEWLDWSEKKVRDDEED